MSVDVRTRQQLWKDMAGNQIDKAAELAGTYDMPNAAPPSTANDTKTRKTVIDKEASVDDLLKVAFEAPGKTEPDDNEASVKGEQKGAPQGKALKPHVDVSGQEPPTLVHEKKAQHYALPSMETYPLDGYDQVEKAAAYFEEWGKRMPPEMRHEYCVNLVKRASALGIPVSEIQNNGGPILVYGWMLQILYALLLDATALPSDKTFAQQLQAATILEKIFQTQPDHPGAAHYLIHSYDYPPIAERGLDAARRYASIAPSAVV